jgi:hypothetical protein
MPDRARGLIAILIGLVFPVASIVMLLTRSLFLLAAIPGIGLAVTIILFIDAGIRESRNQGSMVMLVPFVAGMFAFAAILIVDIVSLFL